MESYLLEYKFLLPILAAIGISICAGTLGCFVIWKRMAYFGDAVSHSALLGIAISLLFAINIDIMIILTCILFAVLLAWFQQNKYFTTDSLLGILAHSSLGVGMLIVSISGGGEIDIHKFLFGDIMEVSGVNIAVIYGCCAIISLLIAKNWSGLCLMMVCPDIARSEKVETFKMQAMLVLLIAFFVGVAIKIFGILLVTSMLIIPPAAARMSASSPFSMVLHSILFASISSIFGVILSNSYNVSSGPAIVVCGTVILAILSLIRIIKR